MIGGKKIKYRIVSQYKLNSDFGVYLCQFFAVLLYLIIHYPKDDDGWDIEKEYYLLYAFLLYLVA